VIEIWTQGWRQFADSVLHPGWGNFFWLLVTVSLIAFALELVLPWRRHQRVLRPELGLDIFYMFFNMFFFPLLGFTTLSVLLSGAFEKIALIQSLRGWISLRELPSVWQIVILFLVRDFLQWSIHVVLHRVPFLWKIHEVHHSAIQMSFPVHLRYHWAENIIYRVPEYLVFFMVGSNVQNIFIIYVISLTIGHLSHANFRLLWGPLKYILNTAELHLWHHAVESPKRYGVNFAISLSVWDWLFQTAYDPRKLPAEIGLNNEPNFPKKFFGQLVWPWKA
jgi:sterol desaturase/sphingolipid hydroxylase (fatty acid hydroxylase superfamily)